MSLETEIAGLTSKVTSLIDYFNGFKSSSARAIADAVAAAPSISRAFFVNQLIGDDNALGNVDSPFKTIERAIAATPDGGVADISLVENYTLDVTISVKSRRIMIRGDNGSSNSRKLTLNEYLSTNGMKKFGGFQVDRGGAVDFADMTISLPDSAGGLSAAQDNYYAMVYGGGSKTPGFLAVKLYNVVFALRGTFTGKFIGSGVPCVSLGAINCTIPAALEGSMVNGVAAGKDPSTIPWLTTNISRL